MTNKYYTDGDFRRREHHRMHPIAGFEMILWEDYKSRDKVEGLIVFPKYNFKPQHILGTFCDVPDNKVAICYIIWLPIALPGSCIKYL